MALTYTREYDHILDDLSRAVTTVPQFFEAFEMDLADWESLSQDEQDICVRTLSDDLFYVLGTETTTPLGQGSAEFDDVHHVIKVIANSQLVHIISLKE
jgi:hypothetical protein